MATNLSIDMRLLQEAQKIGCLKTKKETVNQALEEFIQRRKSEGIISMFGSVEYDKDYDHKAARTRGE